MNIGLAAPCCGKNGLLHDIRHSYPFYRFRDMRSPDCSATSNTISFDIPLRLET